MASLHLSADEVLTTTRAVRKRLDLTRPVERAVLEECLTIAMQAPTASNSQRWSFVVVTDSDKRAAIAAKASAQRTGTSFPPFRTSGRSRR